MQSKRLIRRPEVLRKTSVSAATLARLEKGGSFPKHIMITPRCAVWYEEQVDAWIDSRTAAAMSPQRVPDGGPDGRRRQAAAKRERAAA